MVFIFLELEGFGGRDKEWNKLINKYIKRISIWEVVLIEEMLGGGFEIGGLGKIFLKRRCLGWVI